MDKNKSWANKGACSRETKIDADKVVPHVCMGCRSCIEAMHRCARRGETKFRRAWKRFWAIWAVGLVRDYKVRGVRMGCILAGEMSMGYMGFVASSMREADLQTLPLSICVFVFLLKQTKRQVFRVLLQWMKSRGHPRVRYHYLSFLKHDFNMDINETHNLHLNLVASKQT